MPKKKVATKKKAANKKSAKAKPDKGFEESLWASANRLRGSVESYRLFRVKMCTNVQIASALEYEDRQSGLGDR